MDNRTYEKVSLSSLVREAHDTMSKLSSASSACGPGSCGWFGQCEMETPPGTCRPTMARSSQRGISTVPSCWNVWSS